MRGTSGCAHVDGCHDGFDILGIEFQDAVEDADFVVAEGLFACAMKLEKRLEFGFLVRVCFVYTEDAVQKLGDGPGDRSWCG